MLSRRFLSRPWLAALITLPILLGVARANVIISEVLFFPSGSEVGREWVELQNTGGAPVTITGWTITNNNGFNFTFPAYTLGPGEFVTVNTGIGTNYANNLFAGLTSAVLNNTGDNLLLRTSSGEGNNPVHYIAWGTGTAITGPPGALSWTNNVNIVGLSSGSSIAYMGGSTSNGNSWSVLTSPTKNFANNVTVTGTVRINEFLPAPPGGNGEFIELYYDGEGTLAAFDLTTNSGTLSRYQLPNLPYSGTGHIVVYLQSGPPAGNAVNLNLAVNRLATAGDSITVRRVGDDQPLDYVSYGGVVASPPAPLVFNQSISTTAPYADGDSFAFIGTNPDVSAHWINRRGANITPGVANTQQPDPEVLFGTVISPPAFPDLDSCLSFAVPILINHTDEAYLRDVVTVFTLPAGMLYVSNNLGGTFDAVLRTVTFNLGTLTDSQTLEVTMRAAPGTTVAQIDVQDVEVDFRRYSGGHAKDSVNADPVLSDPDTIDELNIAQPEISVEVERFPVPGQNQVLVEQGNTVDLRVRVVNSSADGTLVGDGAGVTLNLGPNLSLVSVKRNTVNGPTPPAFVQNNLTNVHSWNTGVIDPQDSSDFFVRVRVLECDDIDFEVTTEWGCGDGADPFAPEVDVALMDIFCPLVMDIVDPLGPNEVYDACNDFEFEVQLTNTNDKVIQLTDVVLSFNPAFYFMGSDIAGAIYNQAASPKTVTLPGAELGVAGELSPGESTVALITLRPNCNAPNERRITAVTNYELEGGNGSFSSSKQKLSDAIQVRLQELNLAVSDPLNPAATTVLAERGDAVEFRVTVTNDGLGDADFAWRPAGEQGPWVELQDIGNALQILDVIDEDTSLSVPSFPSAVGEQFNAGPIPAGDSKTFTVIVFVNDCDDLAVTFRTYFECEGTDPSDTCLREGNSSGSVEIILKAPDLQYAAPNINIDYCGGSTIGFWVSNPDPEAGRILDFHLDILGLDLARHSISTTLASDFSFQQVGNTARFILSNGENFNNSPDPDDLSVGPHLLNDMAAEGEYWLEFEIERITGECGGASSGGLTFVPVYTDSCNTPFTFGVQQASWSVQDREIAALNFSPGSDLIDIGGVGETMTIDIVYFGNPGDPFRMDFELDYDFKTNTDDSIAITAIDVVGGPSASIVNASDDNLGLYSFELHGEFDLEREFNATVTITYNAPVNSCVAQEAFNMSLDGQVILPNDPEDCKECPLTTGLSGSVEILIQSAEVDNAIVAGVRDVTFINENFLGLDNGGFQGAGEDCTEIIVDHRVRFSDDAPTSWNAVVFDDPFEAGLSAVDINALQLEVYYFDTNGAGLPTYASAVASGNLFGVHITASDVDLTVDGLEIDLSGLNALAAGLDPSDEGVLWFRYRLDSGNVAATVVDRASLNLPLMPGAPDCDETGSTNYTLLEVYDIRRSAPVVSITNVPGSVVQCAEGQSVRFSLGHSRPFDSYDVQLTVELGDGWIYEVGTAIFSNLVDGNGDPLATEEPVLLNDGRTLVWQLGDLRGLNQADTFIEIIVNKTCDVDERTITAQLQSNYHCTVAAMPDRSAFAWDDFDRSNSATYSPTIQSGLLTTAFATNLVYYNDGYPRVRLNVVNSGSAPVYNIRLDMEFGEFLNSMNPKVLSFREARVAAISGGAVPGMAVNQVLDDDDTQSIWISEGEDGDTLIQIAMDELPANRVVTLEFTTRMHLGIVSGLEVNVVDVYSNCRDPNDLTLTPCTPINPASRLNHILIRQGTTRVEVLEHVAVPDVLDLCGSETQITIRAANVGSVQAYEPIIQEILPAGLEIVVDSAQYRLGSGPWLDFPAAGPTGERFSKLEVNVDDEQVITWNFANPFLSELDDRAPGFVTLLEDPAYDDPFPTDPFFTRSRTLKPGQTISIRFDARLDQDSNCDAPLAYLNSSRSATAGIRFDLPAFHDNLSNADGSPVLSGFRDPLQLSTLSSNFIDPGEANVLLSVLGQNITQNGAVSGVQINGESDDLIELTVRMESIGPGVVPQPRLELLVPDNFKDFQFTGITSPGGVITLQDSDPAPQFQPTPTGDAWLYVFEFDNSDPAMIAAGRGDYFAATGLIEVVFTAGLETCSTDLRPIEAKLEWGCCDGSNANNLPEIPSANGEDFASIDVKTSPDAPIITFDKGSIDRPDWTSCGGALTLVITNPDANFEISLRDLVINIPLPAGWEYDDSDVGTVWSYGGVGGNARQTALLDLDPAEEEPVIIGGELVWTSATNGGNIPDGKARIFPRETVTIVFHLRPDGSGINCATVNTSPAVPPFDVGMEFEYSDSCGNPLPAGSANASVIPLKKNIAVSMIPDVSFIDETTDTVIWTLELQNNEDADANNVTLEVTFGDGYTGALTVTPNAGEPSPSTETTSVVKWEPTDGIVVPAGGSLIWTIEHNIDTITRGDLSVEVEIIGECLDRGGNEVCPYAWRQEESFVSGGVIEKFIDGNSFNTPGGPLGPDLPLANVPAGVAAYKDSEAAPGNVFRHIVVVQLFEGGSTNLNIREVLPPGMRLRQANRIDAAGDWIATLAAHNAATSGTVEFRANQNAALANITGGAIGGDAVFVEVWVEIDPDDVDGAFDNRPIAGNQATLENTAQVTIIRGTTAFDHASNGLADTTETSILEPFLLSTDGFYTKVSDPVSLNDEFDGDPLDLVNDGNEIDYRFTVRNSGEIAAHQIRIEDRIPFGMEVDLASVVLGVDETGDDVINRTLVEDTDYSLSFVMGVGGNRGLLTVQFLDTFDATLEEGETVILSYTGAIVAAAPGAKIVNRVRVAEYNSLPEGGGSVTTSAATVLDEAGRLYGGEGNHRPMPELLTYHYIEGEIESTKAVKAELTTPEGGGPIDQYRSAPDKDTRATAGEVVTFQARLKIPAFVTLYDVRFEDDIPDGLTVQSIQWELVDPGDELSVPDTIVVPGKVDGETPIDSSDFGASLFGDITGKDLLIEIETTVDLAYDNEDPLEDEDEFTNTATFTWAAFDGGPVGGEPEQTSVTDHDDGPVGFTVLLPHLVDLVKSVSDHQFDNGDPVLPVELEEYRNYYDDGPDGPVPTDPVEDVQVVRPGEWIEFTLTFENTGSATAYDVEIISTLPQPDGVAYGLLLDTDGSRTHSVTATTPGFTSFNPLANNPSQEDNEITITLDKVAAGDEVTINFWVRVQAGTSAGAYLQTRTDFTEYRSTPEVDATYPALAKSLDTSPAFEALDIVYAGLGTPYPEITLAVASDISDPDPGDFLDDGSARGTIGEEMTYQFTVKIPALLALRNWQFQAVLPDGMILTPGSANYQVGAAAPVLLDVSPGAQGGTTNLTNDTAIDVFESVVGSDPEPEIVVTIRAIVGQELDSGFGVTNDDGDVGFVDAGDTIAFSAGHVWDQFDDIASQSSRDFDDDPVLFTVIEPELVDIEKHFEKALTDADNPAIALPEQSLPNYYTMGPEHPATTDPVSVSDWYTAGNKIHYRIEVTNQGDSPAYQVEIDELIPVGMTYDDTSEDLTVTSGVSVLSVLENEPYAGPFPGIAEWVRFGIDRIDPGATATIRFTATIDTPVAAGRYLQNRASLNFYSSLPEDYDGTDGDIVGADVERSTDDAVATLPYSVLEPQYAFIGTPMPQLGDFTKTIGSELTPPDGLNSDGSSRATIGEWVRYEIRITIEENLALYDFMLVDQIPDGLNWISDETEFTLNGIGVEGAIINDGRWVGLLLDDPVGTNGNDEIVLTISGQLRTTLENGTTPVVAGNTLLNTFSYSWNQINEGPDSPGPGDPGGPLRNFTVDERETVNTVSLADPVTFTVVEPELEFSFAQENVTTPGFHATDETFFIYTQPAGGAPVQVDNVPVALPGETIRHRLRIDNTGDAFAFEIELESILPAQPYVDYQLDAVVNYRTIAGDADVNADYAASNFQVILDDVELDGLDHDRLFFTLRHLHPGHYAEVVYTYELQQPLGAGQYLGPHQPLLTGVLQDPASLRVAELENYRSLPVSSMDFDVGNLDANEDVYDIVLAQSQARDSDSGVAIGDPEPYEDQDGYDHLGIMFPEFEKKVYRLLDEHGDLLAAPEEIPVSGGPVGARRVRIGEVLRYELNTSLPPRTALFDGSAGGLNGLLLRDELPRGFRLRSGSESDNFSADLSGDLKGAPSASHSAQREIWIWSFEDVVNELVADQEFIFQFDVDVTHFDVGGTEMHASVTGVDATVTRNLAWLFWETDDRGLGRESADASAGLATGDHPFLADDESAVVQVVQPDLSFTKLAWRYDATGDAPARVGPALASQELIGVTAGVGDVIVYGVEVTQAGSSADINSAAYDIEVTDRLPVNLRPATMAGGADLNSSDLVAVVTDDSDNILQVLQPDTGGGGDYVLTYDDTTGIWTFNGQYNTVEGTYRARIDLQQKLKLFYRVQLDAGVGAKGGGFGLRVNRADLEYMSFPEVRANSQIAGSGWSNTDAVVPKDYDPADKTFALLLDTPIARKTAYDDGTPDARPDGSSVKPEEIIVYRIAVPWGPIRANMYDVEIIDIIPDGLVIDSPADVEVFGADATVTVSGTNNRNIKVEIERIQPEESDTDVTERFGDTTLNGDFLDLDSALITEFDDDAEDQVVVVITAKVSAGGVFDNNVSIARLHEFKNFASVFWYDEPDTAPDRNYYGVVTGFTSHFFDASGIIFEPSHTEGGIRGTIKSYPHRLRNFSDEPQEVAITWPESTRGWGWTFYVQDNDTGEWNGPYVSGHVVSLPVRDLNANESGTLELRFRAFIPSEEPPNATDILLITASDNAPLATFEPLQVSDVTTVTTDQVSVVKSISSTGLAGSFNSQVETQPDNPDRVWNRLSITNFSSEFIKEVHVFDFLPEYTQYVAYSATDLGGEFVLSFSDDNGVSWTDGEPADHLPTQSTSAMDQVVPGVTNLRWKYIGDTGGRGAGYLEPGEEKILYFQMRIR